MASRAGTCSGIVRPINSIMHSEMRVNWYIAVFNRKIKLIYRFGINSESDRAEVEKQHITSCEIQGSHGDDWENCHLMGRDVVQSGRKLPMCQGNLLPILHWRRRKQVPPKRWQYFTRLHSLTSEIFTQSLWKLHTILHYNDYIVQLSSHFHFFQPLKYVDERSTFWTQRTGPATRKSFLADYPQLGSPGSYSDGEWLWNWSVLRERDLGAQTLATRINDT
jgi:hypothetical protein